MTNDNKNKQRIRYYVLSTFIAFAFLGLGFLTPNFASAASSPKPSHGVMMTTASGHGVYTTRMLSFGMIQKNSPLTKVLASGQSQAQPMAISNGNVYWFNYGNGQINRVSMKGGSVDTITTVDTSTYTVFGIAVQGKFVYWSADSSTGGHIFKTRISNGSTKSIESSASADNFGITTGGNYVFYVDYNGTTGNVMRMSRDGAGLTTIGANVSLAPWQVVYSNGYVYWYDLCTGQVGKVSQNGGPSTPLSPELGPVCTGEALTGIEQLVVNGTNVYWTFNYAVVSKQTSNSSVDRVSTSGSNFAMLYSDLGDTFAGVAGYGSNIIFADFGFNNLYSIPNTGGTLTTILTGYQFTSVGIVKSHLYSTTQSDVIKTRA